jgi:serralysin
MSANTPSTTLLATRVDLADTFCLHSRPKASKTIYLDFNGHTTTGTSWNVQAKREVINTPIFNSDANTAVFSDAELERIQFIWQRVAEDFLPFGVNVTTEDPGEEALINTGGEDNRWGVRAAIGGTNKDWSNNAGSGGISYYNGFGSARCGPVFVFSGNLSKGNEKNTAEAISHEVGHSLGLEHDHTAKSAYFGGQGTGPTGWAPIMGSAYGKPLSQWSQGEFKGSINQEDDLAIIASPQNGVGFRADDFGDSITKATPLIGPSLNQFGIISTRNDTDWFSFVTETGTVSLAIENATQAWISDGSGNFTSTLLIGRGPNLDIEARVFTTDGTLVAANNSKGTGASFDLTLTAGTYYLQVDGVGFGDPLKNGYSDYGSLGGYLVSGSLA